MKNKNFYRILGVSPDSEDVVITAAYKALMRKYHPDKSSNADATLKAAEINEAYDVLSDPEKREAYDHANGHSQSERADEEQSTGFKQSSEDSEKAKASDDDLDPSAPYLKWRLGQVGGIAIGVIFIALVIVASRNSNSDYSTETSSDYADATADAADFAATDIPTPIVDQPLPIDTSPLDRIELGLPDLSVKMIGPPTPLSYPDIEKAVIEFDRVLARSGITGAKAYSIKCHDAAKRAVEWSKFDFCVAFDLSAAYLDNAMTEDGAANQNPYFSFMSDNASDQYVGAQVMSYTLNQRVSSIRRAVRPVLIETVRARVEKNKTEIATESSPKSDSDVTSSK